VTDFLPKRYLSLLVTFLAGLMAISAVLALYLFRVHQLARWSIRGTEALELSGTGTIASWLASFFMLLAAVAAAIVYGLRRHKVDDYRGRYRVWLWVALACVAASIDLVSGAHRLLDSALSRAIGTTSWNGASLWWLVVWGLFGSLLGLRLLWDVRGVPLAIAAVLVAASCYVSACLLDLDLVTISNRQWHVLAQAALALLGHQLILFSFLAFARHVYREAQDAASSMRRKPRRRGQTKGVMQVMSNRSDAGGKPPESVEHHRGESGDDRQRTMTPDRLDVLSNPNLTKTERRKLRKLLKREQRRAA
jgi:hypothetical protein